MPRAPEMLRWAARPKARVGEGEDVFVWPAAGVAAVELLSPRDELGAAAEASERRDIWPERLGVVDGTVDDVVEAEALAELSAEVEGFAFLGADARWVAKRAEGKARLGKNKVVMKSAARPASFGKVVPRPAEGGRRLRRLKRDTCNESG